MNLYAENDSRFPEDTEVKVRFPLADEQHHGERGAWPWVNGFILGQCGPDEWAVCVDGVDPVDYEGGAPLYPCVFRDSSEIHQIHDLPLILPA
jgi:hypothetical protein